MTTLNAMKGTVHVIPRDFSFEDWHTRFTTIPFTSSSELFKKFVHAKIASCRFVISLQKKEIQNFELLRLEELVR